MDSTNEPVALKVVKGEICYLSDKDDQSYGFWCPINYDTTHGYAEDTKFYTHPVKELTDEEMYEFLEKYQGIELCKAILRKASE